MFSGGRIPSSALTCVVINTGDWQEQSLRWSTKSVHSLKKNHFSCDIIITYRVISFTLLDSATDHGASEDHNTDLDQELAGVDDGEDIIENEINSTFDNVITRVRFVADLFDEIRWHHQHVRHWPQHQGVQRHRRHCDHLEPTGFGDPLADETMQPGTSFGEEYLLTAAIACRSLIVTTRYFHRDQNDLWWNRPDCLCIYPDLKRRRYTVVIYRLLTRSLVVEASWSLITESSNI